jgi:hypothetical protein
VNYIYYIFAVAAGSIVGLVVSDLVHSSGAMWGVISGAAAFGLVLVAGFLVSRPEDSDPTIRPPNVSSRDDSE